MTTIDRTQHEIERVIRKAEADLNSRGVLMIDRAHTLHTAVKQAKLLMELTEKTTPADFLNPRWGEQATTLQQLETRLIRIIRGVRVPTDDHERLSPANEA